MIHEYELKDFIQTLNTEQKTQLLSIIKRKKNSEPIINLEETRFSHGLFCVKCGCTDKIVKKGFSTNKKQRYLCRNCSSIFTLTTDSFLSSTKKNTDTWLKYIECMTRQLSIKKSSEICGISIRTSFMWRHKILDFLRLFDKTELRGVIESDEAYFRVSYKGSEPVSRRSRRQGSSMFDKRKRGFRPSIPV